MILSQLEPNQAAGVINGLSEELQASIEEMAVVVTDRMAQRLDESEVGSILAQFEGLSNEEATRLLAQARDEA